MTKLQIIMQALTDPENQPHQWVGNKEGLAKDIYAAIKHIAFGAA